MIEGLALKAGQLIFVGMALSIGFYCGKKLTNQVDYLLYIATHRNKSDEEATDIAKKQEIET